uniref:Uncharacterized protein n=1 Tax=Plectus sambesii TaxID=2011161 RepID=A0A914WM70_9BILA
MASTVFHLVLIAVCLAAVVDLNSAFPSQEANADTEDENEQVTSSPATDASNVQPFIRFRKSDVEPFIRFRKNDVEPFIRFRKSEVEPFIRFRKSDVEPFIRFRKSDVEPFIRFRKSDVEPFIRFRKSDVDPFIRFRKFYNPLHEYAVETKKRLAENAEIKPVETYDDDDDDIAAEKAEEEALSLDYSDRQLREETPDIQGKTRFNSLF